jgi:microcystin-dependent protein
MAISFPVSPIIDQRHTEDGVTWVWDGVAWAVDGTALTEIWPVGSIYMTMAATLPPQFTANMTWVRVAEGRLIVGVGQYDPAGRDWVQGEEFGADEVVLTEAQIPAHTHGSGTLVTNSTGAHTHDVYFANNASGGGSQNEVTGQSGADGDKNTSSAGSHSHSISGLTASAGSGGGHNNIQPSLAAYIWERTA